MTLCHVPATEVICRTQNDVAPPSVHGEQTVSALTICSTTSFSPPSPPAPLSEAAKSTHDQSTIQVKSRGVREPPRKLFCNKVVLGVGLSPILLTFDMEFYGIDMFTQFPVILNSVMEATDSFTSRNQTMTH